MSGPWTAVTRLLEPLGCAPPTGDVNLLLIPRTLLPDDLYEWRRTVFDGAKIGKSLEYKRDITVGPVILEGAWPAVDEADRDGRVSIAFDEARHVGEPINGEWVSVKERVPKKSTYALLCVGTPHCQGRCVGTIDEYGAWSEGRKVPALYWMAIWSHWPTPPASTPQDKP